ncbi:unnamed protein product [Urochloa decumbens]|uniref:Uncharacterized protein n=1 Tax=Urochloa decumbens TaxID=240449 RepID=A0ABC9B2Q1_9POAL
MDLINAAVWFSIAIVFISTVITKAAAERIMLDATSNISITSAPSDLEMNCGRSHDSIGEAYACMQINVLRNTLLRNLQLESVPPFAGTEE